MTARRSWLTTSSEVSPGEGSCCNVPSTRATRRLGDRDRGRSSCAQCLVADAVGWGAARDHPYDGGADVIAPTVQDRDALRRGHADWLSARPSGL
ncbi:DUF3885 domain-containing protein [Actinomadura geliboluensis]